MERLRQRCYAAAALVMEALPVDALSKKQQESFFNKDSIARFFGICQCNSHATNAVFGKGLSVLVAMLEHSCFPNCYIQTSLSSPPSSDDAPGAPEAAAREERVRVRVLTDQAISKGETISICYNPGDMPVSTRRRYLCSEYLFLCSCRGCTSLPDLNRVFECPRKEVNKCKNGLVMPYRDGTCVDDFTCQVCHEGVAEADVKAWLRVEDSIRAKWQKWRERTEMKDGNRETEGEAATEAEFERALAQFGAVNGLDKQHHLMPRAQLHRLSRKEFVEYVADNTYH